MRGNVRTVLAPEVHAQGFLCRFESNMQAGFLTAERGSEDEVIVVIHKVPVGERDRDADNREGIAMSWSSRRGASAATGGRPPLRAWRACRRPVLALPAVAVVALAACSAGPGGTTAARQPGGRAALRFLVSGRRR